MIVVFDSDVDLVLLMLGDGIWAYTSHFLIAFIWPFTVLWLQNKVGIFEPVAMW